MGICLGVPRELFAFTCVQEFVFYVCSVSVFPAASCLLTHPLKVCIKSEREKRF
jgi:hypothetical protein